MKQKSIKLNATMSMLNTLLGLLFSIITLPYVTRALGVESYGRVIYANSIVSYFLLIAGLGISDYAMREGATVRDDKKKFSDLTNEIFTLNMLSTLVSYVLLVLVVLFVPGLKDYKVLIGIISTEILFNTLSLTWVYKAYEEYIYTILTGILIQIITFTLILFTVNKPEHYYRYAFIWALTYILTAFFNLARLYRFTKLRIVLRKEVFQHIKPIMILFASSIASTIYISSDTTILGYVSGDYYTGLYTVSSRIYGILKNILIAALTVSVPRFSYYFNNDMKQKFSKLIEEIQGIMVLMVFPMIIGIVVLSKELIIFLFGEAYVEAERSLQILGVALFFCMIAWISSQCILIPTKKETLILKVTVVSGVANIVLNLILIPYFQQNATATTTLISEGIVAIIYLHYTKEYWKQENWKHMVQCLVSAGLMGIIVFYLRSLGITPLFLRLCFCILSGAGIYFGLLLLARNKILLSYIRKSKRDTGKGRIDER